MPITYQIPDSELQGFSGPSQTEVRRALQQYGQRLVKEIRSIEEIRRKVPGQRDVAVGMVVDAKDILEKKLGVRTPKLWLNGVRVIAFVLSYIAGDLRDPASPLTLEYALLFATALISGVLAVVWED